MAGVPETTGIQSALYFNATVPAAADTTTNVYVIGDFVGDGLTVDNTSDTTLKANRVEGMSTSDAMEQSANTISVGVLGESSQRTYPGQSTPAEFTFEVLIDYTDGTHTKIDKLAIGTDALLVFYTAKSGGATLDWAKVQLAGKSKQIAPDDVTRVSYTWTLPHGPFATLHA